MVMTDLAALVATRMEKLRTFKTGVSMSVHTPKGPSILTTGTLGKTIVPSGIAKQKQKRKKENKQKEDKIKQKKRGKKQQKEDEL